MRKPFNELFDIVFIYGMWLLWTIFTGLIFYKVSFPWSFYITLSSSGIVALLWWLRVAYGHVGNMGMYYFVCHILPALVLFVLSLFVYLLICVYTATASWL
jgi:hypothetical protein